MSGLFGTPVSAHQQVRRVADMQARIATTDEAIQASLAAEGGTPEVREFRARWAAFKAEVNALQQAANSPWRSVTDEELQLAEGKLNALTTEWNKILPLEIQNRRREKQIGILQAGLAHTTQAKPGEPHTPIKLPDTTPQIERSAATQTALPPPPPPSPVPMLPTGAKVAIVGGAALGTLVGTIASVRPTTKAAVGTLGGLGTALLAYLMFRPDAPAAPPPASTATASSASPAPSGSAPAVAPPPAPSGGGGGDSPT